MATQTIGAKGGFCVVSESAKLNSYQNQSAPERKAFMVTAKFADTVARRAAPPAGL